MTKLCDHFFEDYPVIWRGYDKRLEKACQRAYAFSAGNLKTISTILKEGLDANSITTEETFEQLSDVYQGKGKFQRAASDLLH